LKIAVSNLNYQNYLSYFEVYEFAYFISGPSEHFFTFLLLLALCYFMAAYYESRLKLKTIHLNLIEGKRNEDSKIRLQTIEGYLKSRKNLCFRERQDTLKFFNRNRVVLIKNKRELKKRDKTYSSAQLILLATFSFISVLPMHYIYKLNKNSINESLYNIMISKYEFHLKDSRINAPLEGGILFNGNQRMLIVNKNPEIEVLSIAKSDILYFVKKPQK